VVQFIQTLDDMLRLLDDGRLDAAAVPSAVNIESRLDTLGVKSSSALGEERVYLDLEGSDLTIPERRFIARELDRQSLEEGFVRDAGQLEGELPAGPVQKPDEGLELAAPAGDELLILIQRVVQARLKEAGVAVDLVVTDPRTFYSQWAIEDPFDLAVRRTFAVPKGASGAVIDAIPLFRVDSVIGFGSGVSGVVANPTGDGPLWNAERFAAAPE
jgi:hypothetical protein